MKRESNNELISSWLEEIWEEIEVQFCGIIFAIIFFGIVYLFFHPHWMIPALDFFKNNKL